MERVELKKVFIDLLTPNIILVTAKDDIVLESSDILELKEYNLSLTEGKEYGVILDSMLYTSISTEARNIMTSKSVEKNRLATAIVVHELPQRIIGNFYIKFNKPSVPTKLFSNKKEALIWMEKIIQL